MEKIIGQQQPVVLLNRLLSEQAAGRTIILQGQQGIGKFSLAVEFAREAFGKNPFLSPDFIFYRNDSFGLKTRFFIDSWKEGRMKPFFQDYLFYLMGRLSNAIAYGEIAKSGLKLKKLKKGGDSYQLGDFRNDLEEILLNNKLEISMDESAAFSENLVLVSDELSKKQRVPIDFIRNLIEFNSQKPSGKMRVSVIGNFENATEEAQNSSLKLFEEPSGTSLIFLTAVNLQSILPTILSRSVVIRMNQLTPLILGQITGIKIPDRFHNTVDWMEDRVFHFRQRGKDHVVYFFEKIAPAVQYSQAVFQFIDELSGEESGRMPLEFLEELLEFLRNLHLYRQGVLRNADYGAFIDGAYAGIAGKLAKQTYAAELAELSAEISAAIRGIRYSNNTEAIVMPALLINLARWYQRRSQ